MLVILYGMLPLPSEFCRGMLVCFSCCNSHLDFADACYFVCTIKFFIRCLAGTCLYFVENVFGFLYREVSVSVIHSACSLIDDRDCENVMASEPYIDCFCHEVICSG